MIAPARSRRFRSIVLSVLVLAVVCSPIALSFAGGPVAAQDGTNETNTTVQATETDAPGTSATATTTATATNGNGTTTANGTSGGNGTNATSPAVVVRQGGQCYPVSAYTNTSQSVQDYYEYRSPFVDPLGWYRAYGPIQELTRADTSQLIFYNGSDGLSLIFLNDGRSNTSGSGGTASVDVSGLPADGNWSVQDDDYPDEDDVFEFNETGAHIEWYWNIGNRSDGAAFAGLEGDEWEAITIDPAFNEASPGYPYENWDGDPEDNQVTSWVVRSANGTTYELDMDEPATITPAPCDDEAPNTTLTASPDTATPGTEITLDAGGSTDNNEIASYRFDVDGDGTVDETTTNSSVTVLFDEPGSYDARVTAVDGANNTANATATVVVEADTTTTRTPDTPPIEGESPPPTESAPSEGTDAGAGSPSPTDGVSGFVSQLGTEVAGMDSNNLIGLGVLVIALLVIGVVVLRR
jgi:hypothetical protein